MKYKEGAYLKVVPAPAGTIRILYGSAWIGRVVSVKVPDEYSTKYRVRCSVNGKHSNVYISKSLLRPATELEILQHKLSEENYET